MANHEAPRPGALIVVAPYLRPERVQLGWSMVLATSLIGIRLASPWPLALAVDHALLGKPFTGPAQVLDGLSSTELLVAAGLATVVLTVLGGLIDATSSWLADRSSSRIAGALRAAVFSHVLSLSLRWHDRVRTGEVLSRLTTDVTSVVGALNSVVTSFLPNTLLLVSSLTILLVVDPSLAWLGLTVLPLLIWLTTRQRRLIRAAELDARDAGGRLSGATADLLRNVRAVQAFGRVDRARSMFAGPNEEAVEARVIAATTEARWMPVPSVILSVGTGIVLVAGGLQVLDGQLSIGELLVALSYLGNLQSPVRGLVKLTALRARASVAALRLTEVLSCDEAVPEPAEPRPVPPVREGLRLQDVSFSYSPDRPVLSHFDLTISAGETVCLFGPSGAGKSTVLHLLLRLYDVDGGRVLIDGVDVRDLSPVALRQQVAFVPQDPWLLDGTLAENIAFGSADATRAQVLAAGKAAWVDEFALSLPEGYDTPLGESGVRLSGGQRRRVALARAVVSTAPAVLLDEPTTSLDAESARQVIGAIRSATRDRTVLLVTHDPVLAAIADRTVHVTPRRRVRHVSRSAAVQAPVSQPAPPPDVSLPGTDPGPSGRDDGAPKPVSPVATVDPTRSAPAPEITGGR